MWILLLMIVIMPFEENPYLLISDSFLGIFPRFTMIKLFGLVGLAWSLTQILGSREPVRLFASFQARGFVVFMVTITLVGVVSGMGMQLVTRLVAVACLLPMVLAAVNRQPQLLTVLRTCGLILVIVFPYAYRQMRRFSGRMGVGLYESNYYALLVVLLIPLSIVFGRHERGWRRWLWWAGTSVLLLELVLTGSRGGFLGLLLVLVLLAFRLMKRAIPALIGIAVALLVVLLVVPNPMTRRLLASGLSDDFRDAGVEASNQQRLEVVKAGLRMVQANPVFGVGLGNFKARVLQYGQGDLEADNIAHNTYLELAAELGIAALASFLLVVGAALVSLGRTARLARSAHLPLLEELAIGLHAGLWGYLVGAFFLSAQYEKFFWLVIFLTICLERIARREARRAHERLAAEAAA
jgi:O-antigen ligase